MNNRPSRIVLMFRMFCTLFVIVFLISVFWNTLQLRSRWRQHGLPPAFSKWLMLAAVHRLNQIAVGRTL